MDVREFVPAPAQGVLAYQTIAEDKEMRKILFKLHDEHTVSCTNIERKVLQMMDGGCHLPLGVHVYKDEIGNYHAYGAFSSSLDKELTKANISSNTSFHLAEQLYEALTTA